MVVTANVVASENGTSAEKTRVSLSSIISTEFNNVVKAYCDAKDVDRSDLIRTSVAGTLRDAGYTVDPAWLESASREESAKRAGAARSAKAQQLKKTASAAAMFLDFLKSSGNAELAAQFNSFLSGGSDESPDTEEAEEEVTA